MALIHRDSKVLDLMLIEAEKALERLQNSPYLYEALAVMGEYYIEEGKALQISTHLVRQGVQHLKEAWTRAQEHYKSEPVPALADRVAQLKAEFRRAASLLFLMQHRIDTVHKKELQAILKNTFSTLKKLCISQKVPKPNRPETTQLKKELDIQIEKEQIDDLWDLQVPSHLLCPISCEIMTEPVTIESGRTYEKTYIMNYFDMQRVVAQKIIADADSDSD